MPRRHFCDPSLAVAALSGNPDRLLNDLEWLGLLIESLVIRDQRVPAQALEGDVFHYRDAYRRADRIAVVPVGALGP
jgi:hypothetical protein